MSARTFRNEHTHGTHTRLTTLWHIFKVYQQLTLTRPSNGVGMEILPKAAVWRWTSTICCCCTWMKDLPLTVMMMIMLNKAWKCCARNHQFNTRQYKRTHLVTRLLLSWAVCSRAFASPCLRLVGSRKCMPALSRQLHVCTTTRTPKILLYQCLEHNWQTRTCSCRFIEMIKWPVLVAVNMANSVEDGRDEMRCVCCWWLQLVISVSPLAGRPVVLFSSAHTLRTMTDYLLGLGAVAWCMWLEDDQLCSEVLALLPCCIIPWWPHH